MGKTRVSHKVYAAWDYKKEIEDLNKQSQEGWQLVKGGCFHSVYEEDHSVQYRYQLDYNTDIKNRMRYIEMFREQGWEYMNSTYNGWHYFRKPYDPEFSEEEYEIYTENTMISEMEKRWIKLVNILAVICSVFAVVQLVRLVLYPEWTRVPMVLMMLTLVVMTTAGSYRLKHKEKYKGKFPVENLITLTIILWITGMMLAAFRPSCKDKIHIDDYTGMYSKDMQVRYTDNYYLDLQMDNEIPIKFCIKHEDGEVIYENRDLKVEKEDIQLKLRPGLYYIYIANDNMETGGRVDIAYDLN